jgi:hypothetical protein
VPRTLGQTRLGRALGLLLGTSALLAALVVSPAAAASTPPVVQRTPAVVTTDPLPTAQIDGVVWSQAITGHTVFAGGRFSRARPAGAPPGRAEVPRHNLMSFDLRTGVMTRFAPDLNGQVKGVAVSPDGRTVVVVGGFTRVGLVVRNHFAAFDVDTGALRPLAPSFNASTDAVAVTATAVYVGGTFSRVDGWPRSRLAAVRLGTGALTGWAPTADAEVHALTLTPDGSAVVVGGSFARLSSTPVLGLGAVDAGSGTTLPWHADAVVQDYGPSSAVLSLTADGDTVYGTGYSYGAGNFEGAFAINPGTGTIKWLQDCHGDTYGVAALGDVVYSVGHAHYCGNIGGFHESNPRVAYRGLAVTKDARGTVAKNGQTSLPSYASFAGQPAPSLVNWFPRLDAGSYTGMTQAAWSVVGNEDYLVLGGEFPRVNGVAQQGLVRLAVPAVSPHRKGPVLTGDAIRPVAVAGGAPGSVRVTWPGNWDRDDLDLGYELLRDGLVVCRRTSSTPFWKVPEMGWTDSGLAPGRTYRYVLRVRDPDGNTTTSPAAELTIPSLLPATPTPTPTAADPASPFPPH